MGASLAGQWVDMIQSAGIILGLVLNAASFREETRGRKVSTLVELNEQHRQIWSTLFKNPKLFRVLETEVDLQLQPVTLEEDLFVRFVITHFQTTYRAAKLGEVADMGNIQADGKRFFSRPIPSAIWNKFKGVHSQDFVSFIDSAKT